MKRRRPKPANFDYDFTGLAVEVTGDALYQINGGAEVANSIEAQANAQVGDTVTNSRGETHTLTQGDITWAQGKLGMTGSAIATNTPTMTEGRSSSGPSTSQRQTSRANLAGNAFAEESDKSKTYSTRPHDNANAIKGTTLEGKQPAASQITYTTPANSRGYPSTTENYSSLHKTTEYTTTTNNRGYQSTTENYSSSSHGTTKESEASQTTYTTLTDSRGYPSSKGNFSTSCNRGYPSTTENNPNASFRNRGYPSTTENYSNAYDNEYRINRTDMWGIYSIKSGKVFMVHEQTKNNYSPYGNNIIIQDKNGNFVRYGHLEKILVKEGEDITEGRKIGVMGSTGNGNPGPNKHLHVSVYPEGTDKNNFPMSAVLDPTEYIREGTYPSNTKISTVFKYEITRSDDTKYNHEGIDFSGREWNLLTDWSFGISGARGLCNQNIFCQDALSGHNVF